MVIMLSILSFSLEKYSHSYVKTTLYMNIYIDITLNFDGDNIDSGWNYHPRMMIMNFKLFTISIRTFFPILTKFIQSFRFSQLFVFVMMKPMKKNWNIWLRLLIIYCLNWISPWNSFQGKKTEIYSWKW